MNRSLKMNTACCCYSVRRITLILLYLSFVSITLSYVEYYTEGFKYGTSKPIKDFCSIIHEKFNLQSDKEEFDSSVRETYTVLYKGLLSYELLSQTISVVTVVLCLYGIHAGRAGFMFPHLIHIFIQLVLWTVLYLISLGALLYVLMREKGPIYVFFVVTLVETIIHGISIYLYVIIYNCYRQIKERKHDPKDTTNDSNA